MNRQKYVSCLADNSVGRSNTPYSLPHSNDEVRMLTDIGKGNAE
jgi:hypothetical protein